MKQLKIPFSLCLLLSLLSTGCEKSNTLIEENSYTHYFKINANKDTVFTFFVPNAFSPNVDGRNDQFLPKGTGISPDNYNMQIYSRSQLIFETTRWGFAWDGGRVRAGAEVTQQALHIYKIKLQDTTGESHTFTGQVTLIR